MLQCLSKLIFESSVMPEYFTESLVSTVLLLKATSIFGEGLEILGGFINNVITLLSIDNANIRGIILINSESHH